MKIKILSDSTCDLPQEVLNKYNITMIPLSVIKDEKAYIDGINITPSDIFDHVANGGSLCSTAAVNIGEYVDNFSKYTQDYDGIIHINISAEFSSCYQNACLAAEDFENVRVIDSRNLSTGQGLVVLKACELANVCDNLDEIAEKPDFIVLDPPRDGIHPKALQKIVNYGVDHMVYISCKPTSLVRDLEVFLEAGYLVERACAVDQFPWTANVETIVLLSRV